MQQLTRQTDQCVKCGMCLPHCPTYRLTRQEGHSPRGRIALVQALISGSVRPDQAQSYLQGCVACRSCEQVCPSNVPFADLMDSARMQFYPVTSKSSWIVRKVLRLLSSPEAQRFWYRLLWLGGMFGVLALIRTLPYPGKRRVRRMIDMLPDIRYPAGWSRPNTGRLANASDVSLFAGCTGATLGQGSLQAAARCLAKLGYRVSLIENPACCGLAARHAGDQTGAEQLQEQMLNFLEGSHGTIVSMVSACSLSLQELARKQGSADQARIMDLGAFLLKHRDTLPERPAFAKGSSLHVVLHRPCSARFCGDDSWSKIIKALPGIEVREIGQTGCCGAGGVQFLTDHPFSDTLADNLVDQIEPGCSILLTHNMGCELHLRARLRLAGRRIKVMHPVELLDKYMSEH